MGPISNSVCGVRRSPLILRVLALARLFPSSTLGHDQVQTVLSGRPRKTLPALIDSTGSPASEVHRLDLFLEIRFFMSTEVRLFVSWSNKRYG